MTAKATKDETVARPPCKPEKGQEKDQKKETRSQFESRMRRELQDLFNARMAELMKSQIEATKMTAEAANNLAKIHKNQHQQPKKRGVRSSSSSGVRGVSGGATPGLHPGVPEDLKTMMSKTESSVPEILSVVEATDRSAKDIQRSIKSAIRELSTTNNTTGNGNGIPDDETSHNITEEIAAELTVCKFSRQIMSVQF